MQTLWLSPTNFVTGDPSLQISYPFVSHPGTLVTSTTIGDFKWISMAFTLPPEVKIEEVIICYQVTNSQSFISQTRLSEMTTPSVALVRHDDATDLTSTSPVCYTSKVLNPFVPTAAVELSLRLDFQDTSQEIMLGAVGVTIQPAVVVPSYTKATFPPAGLAGSLARMSDNVRGLWMDIGSISYNDGMGDRKQWIGLSGEVVNVKEFGAKGDGTTDDTLAIQAAIDSLGPQGGIVFLPAGTYIIGTEGATTNQPIFVGSNIHLLGSGRGATTLRLPNDVKQAAIGEPGIPAASIFINKGNTWWFKGNQPLPLPSADSNVSIAHMTLDGNKDGQTSVFVPGNLTTNPHVPDPFGGLDPKGISDANGKLAPGDYHLCVTYADLDKKETGKSPTYDVHIDATQNAIQVGLPPLPSEAQGIVVYLARFTLDSMGNVVYEQADKYNDELFERQGPFPLPLPPSTSLIVTTHNPIGDPMAGQVLPPKVPGVLPPGTGVYGTGEAGSRNGIFLDQISDCHIHDLEIRNFVLDGLGISYVGDGVGPITVRDSLFEAIWSHDNGRTGMTITGNAQSLRFVDCWMDRNSAWGFDIEPIFPQNPIRDIHFLNCRFSGSGLAGFAIAPREQAPVDNLSLTNCELDGNLIGLAASAAVGKLTNCRLIGCTFRRNRNVACLINAPGYGLILGCDFDQNSAPEFIHFPNYIPGSADASQLVFEDNTSNWRVIGNRFRPCPLCINSDAIELRGSCTGLVIVGNHYDSGVIPYGVYTLTYQAGSSNQTLTVTFTVQASYSTEGNVTLQAATLVNSDGSGSSGSLIGSKDTPIGTVNLTSEGTADWAHWGMNSAVSFDHKSGVTQQISNSTLIGIGTINKYGNNPTGYTWTDGMPAVAATSTKTGIWVSGKNNGFQITVPADTIIRTLKVYVGVRQAQGLFTATLSDSSAMAYTESSLNDSGNFFFVGGNYGNALTSHIIHSNTGDGYLFDANGKAIDMSVDLPLILGGPITKARNVPVVPPPMVVHLDPPLATIDYQVAVTLGWDGSWWISDKTTTSFTINWTTAPTTTATTLDWTLYL